MSYNNLRLGRYSVGGGIYHVTTVTADRVPFFLDYHVAPAVVREMRQLDDEGSVESLAWVLMPDHLHWLLGLGARNNLGGSMKAFKARSAHKVNRLLGRTGRVWQPAYYDPRVGQYPFWDAV